MVRVDRTRLKRLDSTVLDRTFHRLIDGRSRGPLAAVGRAALRALAVPYGVAVRRRNADYDAGRRPASRTASPVVSVGNLSVGGTGKTPTVAFVADWLSRRGGRVGVLSRGYGSRSGPNDEALVLAEKLPRGLLHIQQPDRVAAAARAVAEHDCDVLVLDDGFQHRRLHRDLDIVLIDATRPPTADRLLPAGLLREPVESLRRADQILLTRCDLASADVLADLHRLAAHVAPSAQVAETVFAPTGLRTHDGGLEPVGRLLGRNVLSLCGIGNPQAFHHTLAACGAEVTASQVFPDHHLFAEPDRDRLARWADRHADGDTLAVCTLKDLVKLRTTSLGGVPLYALDIGMQFRAGERACTDAWRALLRPPKRLAA